MPNLAPLALSGARLLRTNVVRRNEHRARLLFPLALRLAREEHAERAPHELFTERNPPAALTLGDRGGNGSRSLSRFGARSLGEEVRRLVEPPLPALRPLRAEQLGDGALHDLLESRELRRTVEHDRAIADLAVSCQVGRQHRFTEHPRIKLRLFEQ